jgi:hypothetical protein
MIDVARRLCTDSNIPVAEIHTYHWIGDEMRFLPVYKAPADGRAVAARAPVVAKHVNVDAAPRAVAKTPARAGSQKKSVKAPARKPAKPAKAAKKSPRSSKRK